MWTTLHHDPRRSARCSTRRREECIRQGNAMSPASRPHSPALVEDGRFQLGTLRAASSASPRSSLGLRPLSTARTRSIRRPCAGRTGRCRTRSGTSNSRPRTPRSALPRGHEIAGALAQRLCCRRRRVGDDTLQSVHSHVEVENTYCGDWPSGHEGGARRSEPSRPRAPSRGRIDHRDLVGCAVGRAQDTVIAEGAPRSAKKACGAVGGVHAGVGVRSGDDAAAPARRRRNGSSDGHPSFVHALGGSALSVCTASYTRSRSPQVDPARSEE